MTDFIDREARAAMNAAIANGRHPRMAAMLVGVSAATLKRWRSDGQTVRQSDGQTVNTAEPPENHASFIAPVPPPNCPTVQPSDRPAVRLGRPPLVEVEPHEALALRRLYVQTNRARGKGSMTMAARMLARDPETREQLASAILAPRASKHALPVEVRRAMRGLDQAVLHHRDSDALSLGGIYTPGCMRMVRDQSDCPTVRLSDGQTAQPPNCPTGLRRLRAGERQSWDDASINFVTWVPWPWGGKKGDKCSEKFKVRCGRFQLLSCVDDATDFCPGFSYTIRDRDSYRAEDVVSAMLRVWSASYAPERVMIEGGSWQAARALEFLRRAGVPWEDAKGRPHSKLVEGFWNRLWSVLSVYSEGQIGRYRGEMERENDLWIECQQGRRDPRETFPALDTALASISRSIGYLNCEQVESQTYGKWVPAEMHAAGIRSQETGAKLPMIAEHDLACLAWPVYAEAKVRRGMVRTTADTPAGGRRPYHFAGDELAAWNGAPVRISFDPWANPPAATVTLAAAFQDSRPGTVIARDLPCLDANPIVAEEAPGVWQVAFMDGHAAAARAKKLANGAVRREIRILGLDGRTVAAKHVENRTPETSQTVGPSDSQTVKPSTPRIASRWDRLDEAKAS